MNSLCVEIIIDTFLVYQDDKVRISTKVGYGYTKRHFKNLFDIKCVDYNIHHYEACKKVMNKKNMKDVSKNDALKTLKALLHYGHNSFLPILVLLLYLLVNSVILYPFNPHILNSLYMFFNFLYNSFCFLGDKFILVSSNIICNSSSSNIPIVIVFSIKNTGSPTMLYSLNISSTVSIQ